MNNAPPHARPTPGSDLFFMIISTALFAWIGFGMGLTTRNNDGELVPIWVLLLWIGRLGALGMAIAIAVRLAAHFIGEVMYAGVGLLSAIALVVLAIMDLLDTRHTAAIGWFLALFFAIWNGFGSATALRAALGLYRERRAGTTV